MKPGCSSVGLECWSGGPVVAGSSPVIPTLFLLFSLFLFGSCGSSSKVDGMRLHTGDLLFVVNENGNAITQSTVSAGQAPIDHVAIFFMRSGKPFVVEATTGRGVSERGVNDFLGDNAVCLVGNVKGLDSKASVDKALAYVGLPYDSLFEPDDSAMYCSELVQKCYVDKRGKAVFHTIPMSFHDASGTIVPYWIELYRRHGRSVPEGAPGTNPAQLAADKSVTIVGKIRSE